MGYTGPLHGFSPGAGASVGGCDRVGLALVHTRAHTQTLKPKQVSLGLHILQVTFEHTTQPPQTCQTLCAVPGVLCDSQRPSASPLPTLSGRPTGTVVGRDRWGVTSAWCWKERPPLPTKSGSQGISGVLGSPSPVRVSSVSAGLCPCRTWGFVEKSGPSSATQSLWAQSNLGISLLETEAFLLPWDISCSLQPVVTLGAGGGDPWGWWGGGVGE